MAIAVTALVLAFLLSYGLTPIIRDIAVRLDFVDRPDGQRKIQSTPIALGGGFTLLIVTPLVVWLLALWWGNDLWLTARRPTTVVGLLAAVVVLGIVGLLDDTRGMRGSHKLFWQLVAALVVTGSGFTVPTKGR